MKQFTESDNSLKVYVLMQYFIKTGNYDLPVYVANLKLCFEFCFVWVLGHLGILLSPASTPFYVTPIRKYIWNILYLLNGSIRFSNEIVNDDSSKVLVKKIKYNLEILYVSFQWYAFIVDKQKNTENGTIYDRLK